MGRYTSSKHVPEALPTGPHPVWRGIGCLTIILVPLLSFAAASVTLPFFVDSGLVPYDLMVTPSMPDWMWNINYGLTSWLQGLFGRPGLYATIILTLLYIMFLGGILSVVYAYMYRMLNPKRYGPMDAPPPRVKIKKYKR